MNYSLNRYRVNKIWEQELVRPRLWTRLSSLSFLIFQTVISRALVFIFFYCTSKQKHIFPNLAVLNRTVVFCLLRAVSSKNKRKIYFISLLSEISSFWKRMEERSKTNGEQSSCCHRLFFTWVWVSATKL